MRYLAAPLRVKFLFTKVMFQKLSVLLGISILLVTLLYALAFVQAYKAIKTAKHELHQYVVSDPLVSSATTNDGCTTYKSGFGTETACLVRSMNAYRTSRAFDEVIISLDTQLQHLGWQPGDNNAADLKTNVHGNIFVPFTLPYTKDQATLTLFTLQGAATPNSGNITHLTSLKAEPLKPNEYVYGLQVTQGYNALLGTYLPFFGQNEASNSSDSQGTPIPFTVYLPASLPNGYRKNGDLWTSELDSSYYAGVTQEYLYSNGHEVSLTETKDQNNPNWLIQCGDVNPDSNCRPSATTANGDEVYRTTYSDNVRRWFSVHEGTDISIGPSIDMTDDQAMQMLNSLQLAP